MSNEPDPQGFRQAAELLRGIPKVEMDDTHIVEMIDEEIQVSKNANGHGCETVACVGGWFALLTTENNWESLKHEVVDDDLHYVKIQTHSDLNKQLSSCLDWTHGAENLASMLGFDSSSDLTEWAEQNPDIWGNHSGRYMFSREQAWMSEEWAGLCGDLDIHQVAEHLDGVASRLEAT